MEGEVPLYTRHGDRGTTGLIGGMRVSKGDLIIEILGSIDEADASLGIARSVCEIPASCEIIFKVQQDLYLFMADIASMKEDSEKKRWMIDEEHVLWIEKQIEDLNQYYETPKKFLIPGDTYPAAMLDFARTVVRRAERRLVSLHEASGFPNPWGMKYLNRLSSLCYALELRNLHYEQD
jgi:cob(I)alamin adenosyltransferase